MVSDTGQLKNLNN